MDVISLNNADAFLLKDNVIFLPLKSLKEYLVSYDFSYVLKHKQDIFFFFSIQILRAIYELLFKFFFSNIFFWWKIYSFAVIFIYKKLNFYHSFRIFFYFFIIKCDCYSILKGFVIFLMMEFIIACLFLSS